MITLLDQEIAPLKPTHGAEPKEPAAVEPKVEKPAASGFKKGSGPAEEEAPINYQVNDMVLAKWSGDRSWYPAKITSITGSSAAPIYTVKYKAYDGTETLQARDIRPASNKRKEPAPSAAAPLPAPVPHGPGVVTSAAPTMNPGAKRELEKTGEELAKPKKAKKIKAKKELEANQNKWQAFQKNSKMGGKNKKESMFRTPEGINGRGMYSNRCRTMANANLYYSWLYWLWSNHACRPYTFAPCVSSE